MLSVSGHAFFSIADVYFNFCLFFLCSRNGLSFAFQCGLHAIGDQYLRAIGDNGSRPGSVTCMAETPR